MSSGAGTKRDGETVTVAFRGELDAGTCPQFEEKLGEAIESDCERIVVDLSQLAFLDSAGLRSILRARTHARQAGKVFELMRPNDSVRRVFDVSGLG